MEQDLLNNVILYKDHFIEELKDKDEKVLIETFFANIKKNKVFHQLQNLNQPRLHILPQNCDPSIKFRYERLPDDIANQLIGIYVRTTLNI